MSAAGLQIADVIDFTSYRARRDRAAATDSGCLMSSNGAVLAFWPVMLPVVTWVPVWQTPPAPWPEQAS